MNSRSRVTVTRTTPSDEVEGRWVEVCGEIDYTTAQGLYADALALADDGGHHRVLDFAGVEFCDSSGLSALLGIWRRLHADGGTLTVVAAPAHVAKAMRVGGMDRLITVHPRPGGTAPHTTA
ncbi:STAS domain-containing protein [Actinosynnema sp. NPDC023658]|uniref:STAS domain-containing protein n=1 Tax=Actinosynnema sp. NPDC023658 TaxID=3155465 RepID=UPI0033CEF476